MIRTLGFRNRCFEFEANLLKPRPRWRSRSRGYRMLSLRFSLLDGSHCWLRAGLGAWLHVWRSSRAWLSFSIQSTFSCLVSAENQHLSNDIISRPITNDDERRLSRSGNNYALCLRYESGEKYDQKLEIWWCNQQVANQLKGSNKTWLLKLQPS